MKNTETKMNTLKLMIEDELNGFLCQTHSDLNDSLEFVFNHFDLDITDELIDVVTEIHEEFFGY